MLPFVILTTIMFRCLVAGQLCEDCGTEFNACIDQCYSIWMPHKDLINCFRECCELSKGCREQRCYDTYDDDYYDDDIEECNTFMFLY